MGTDFTTRSELSELIADVREQVLYLQELGVEAFDVNLSEISAKRFVAALEATPIAGQRSEISDLRSEIVARTDIPNIRSEIKPQASERPPGGSRLSSLPTLSTRKKTVPFFDKYNPEDRQELGYKKREMSPAVEALPSLPEAAETIDQIRAEIGPDCRRCKLCELGRTKVVNSVGNFDADLMFVGEAPGADEDLQGEPFVGKAGQLLTDIIEKGLQIPRKEVFIGNINRCRPPGNRAPEPDESAVCKPFLQREIAVVRPKVIVVLGATAAQNLLETKVPISKLRGQFHDYLGTKVMPTFHPAYLLRDPHKKREVWEDMKMVRDYLSL